MSTIDHPPAAALRATLTGLIAPLIWGIAVPMERLFFEHYGAALTTAVFFGVAGILGLIVSTRRGCLPFRAALFRNPYLYLRWITFIGHEAAVITAVYIVARENVPVVILINYLWPTATLLFCVLIAGLRVTHVLHFAAGCLLVLAALAIELGGARLFSAAAFANTRDITAYLITFLGALSWGIYSALSRRHGETTGGSDAVPLFELTLACLLPAGLLAGSDVQTAPGASGVLLLLGYGVIQYLAYFGWDYGMRRGSAVIISLGADFIPWISLAAAALLLNVAIEQKTVFSAVLLVVGAMVTRSGTRARTAAAAQATGG